jgi:hypothetical protein
MVNKVNRANMGGPAQLPIRKRFAARIAQFLNSAQ